MLTVRGTDIWTDDICSELRTCRSSGKGQPNERNRFRFRTDTLRDLGRTRRIVRVRRNIRKLFCYLS